MKPGDYQLSHQGLLDTYGEASFYENLVRGMTMYFNPYIDATWEQIVEGIRNVDRE